MLMIAQHVWNGNYIGKTGRNFVTHLKEHRSCDDQHMYKRISKSEQFIDSVTLMKFRKVQLIMRLNFLGAAYMN